MKITLTVSRALADGNRIRAVAALMRHDELCVCQVTELLGLATATVSRHMSILRDAQLVQSRKKGRWVYYRLSSDLSDSLSAWLGESLAGSPEIEADRSALDDILACDPEELCRSQRITRPNEQPKVKD